MTQPQTKPFRFMAIGAHPDDCEIKCSGMASKWIRDGHSVLFCSVTDGRSGHHKHDPDALAEIRRGEAAKAAAAIGAESLILGEPDGSLMPTLEARAKVIAAIRRYKPDLIATHRPNDYHPDHRYTSQLVQDAAYTVQVPLIASETPALDYNPVIVYMSDHFQKPQPFRPDVVVEIDSVMEPYMDVLHEHKSQFYEWLPYVAGASDSVPESDAERRHWLAARMKDRLQKLTRNHADLLRARYGEKANSVACSEAYEGCEYGSPLTKEKIERFFGPY